MTLEPRHQSPPATGPPTRFDAGRRAVTQTAAHRAHGSTDGEPASRPSAFYPGDIARDTSAQDAQARLDQARPTMTTYARRAQVHEMAAAIRGAMGLVVDVPAIIAAIRAKPRSARQALFPLFPHLATELQARVAAADMASIVAEVNAP